MRFIYLLSSKLNYNKLLCADAGPAYAQNMGWEITFLKANSSFRHEDVVIVDNRIEKEEVPLLDSLIENYPKNIFFLKVVDPFNAIYGKHYYYKSVRKHSETKNVYLLSVYEPKELVLEFKSHFGKKFIHVPYPYLKYKEQPLGKNQINKIIISGALEQSIYPYRYGIWRKITRSLTRFTYFTILKHPGYLDINGEQSHQHPYIKDKFIILLSKYKFMLLCPSRCEIEFLKYYECAYAGCIPVGTAPSIYDQKIKDLFLPLRLKSFYRDLLKIFYNKHQKKYILEQFRSYLAQTRSPDILNKKIKKFLIENSLYTS